jgi:signal transduction histidine kinase
MPRPPEARGRIVLPPLAAGAAAALLAPPRVPAATVPGIALAERAAAVAIPVLLSAPAAGVRLRLARALHARGRAGSPFVVASGRRPSLDDLPPGATLYLDLPTLARDVVPAVEAILDDARVWVLAATDPGVAPPPALAMRLRPATLEVPPLADRAAELPALAAAIVAELAARAGRPAPHVSAEAVADLASRSWTADVLELEAVLAHAFLVADGEEIAPHHLGLERRAASGAGATASAAPAPAAPELEYLLAELAHELRNPMVTIKTFARHLPDLLADAELRTRFEGLTNEAIDRMDGMLDNVITFARLGPPHATRVELGPLLDRALAEVHAEVDGRAVHVRSTAPATARFTADPDQLTYALKNLLWGVVREVPPEHELQLDASANGVVTLRFGAGGEAAARLRRLAGSADEPSLADPTLLPLSFRLARAVLERNGGTLSIVPEAPDTTTVVIRLPTPNEAAAD